MIDKLWMQWFYGQNQPYKWCTFAEYCKGKEYKKAEPDSPALSREPNIHGNNLKVGNKDRN